MKKIFLFAITVIMPVILYAQAFTGGISAGLTVNQIDGDEYAGYDKAGFMFGGWVRTNRRGPFQIMGEIRYIGKGAANRANPDQPDNYYRVRLDYVEVPVMFRYAFTGRFSAGLGISAGYLFNGKEDLTGDGYIIPSRPFQSFEIASLVAVGYDFSERFTGEARFAYSMLPIREHPGGQTFLGNLGQYNNTLGFSLYYTFGRKRP